MMHAVRTAAIVGIGLALVTGASQRAGAVLLNDDAMPAAKPPHSASPAKPPATEPMVVPDSVVPRSYILPPEQAPTSSGGIVPENNPPATSGAIVPDGFNQSDRYSNKALNAVNAAKARSYISKDKASGSGKKVEPCATITIGTIGDVNNDPANASVVTAKNVNTSACK